MAAIDVVEPAIVGGVFLLYILYHIYLWLKYRRNPMSTTLGHNHRARRLWVHTVMRDRRDILAVQTLRNTLMSSSLLATTSLTLSAIVAAYLVNTEKLESGLDLLASQYLSSVHKFFGVILCFAIAFYFYMQSVRASNHVGYLINLPQFMASMYTPEYVSNVLGCGADFHTAGTRVFYLAFLCVIWVFGPLPPLIFTLILIAHLFYLDRADPFTAQSSPSPSWNTKNDPPSPSTPTDLTIGLNNIV